MFTRAKVVNIVIEPLRNLKETLRTQNLLVIKNFGVQMQIISIL